MKQQTATKATVVTQTTPAGKEPITKRRLKNRNIVVLIPAYNEERFVGSLVLKLQAQPATVVVVMMVPPTKRPISPNALALSLSVNLKTRAKPKHSTPALKL